MNKKKLMMVPVVAVVVAMFGVSVLAASPAKNVKVEDADKNTVAATVTESSETVDLTKVDGLADKVKAINSEAKLEDAKFVVGYDVSTNEKNSPFTVTVYTTISANEIGILVHKCSDGSVEVLDVEKGAVDSLSGTVNEFSPFLVYKIAVQSSSQTGEYATPYIVMISVALVACGAVFAVRAKKATK